MRGGQNFFSFFPCDQCRGGPNLIYMVSFFNDNNDDNYRKAVSVSASFLQRLWEDPRLWYDFELHYCTIFLWQWQYRDHLVGQLTMYDFAFQSIYLSFITNRHYSVQFFPSESPLTPKSSPLNILFTGGFDVGSWWHYHIILSPLTS